MAPSVLLCVTSFQDRNLARNNKSRRSFLQAGAGGALSSLPQRPSSNAASKTTSNPPRALSPDLYIFEDTCNVFLLRRGSRGLLIDFGSGAILPHLPALGIEQIDWILHTHHHRDQCSGDTLAVARGIPIAVPEAERPFFADVETFWQTRRIVELYDVRNDFFSLTQNVPVSALLRDYSTFEWRGLSFFVQPTPGHTPGSITLVVEVDGLRVAFTGDLIHSPGKVQTLYDLQYAYAEHEGVDLSIYSLDALSKLKPELLCPSHGEPMTGAQEAITALDRNLRQWHSFWYNHPPTADLTPVAVSPHLIASTETTSSFYAILSDSGKALLVDYGGASWTFFQVYTRYVDTFGHMRFLHHSIDKLRDRFGVKEIDVVIPSHMHDDHVNGIPILTRRYGTKVWAHECMVDILQHPRSLNVGCIFGEPLRIDRVLRNRETFRWQEYEFTVVHSPGHTHYEMAMFGIVDGKRIGFTGDAFFADAAHPDSLRHNLIYRNRLKTGDYLASLANLVEFQPEMLAPGHGKPFAVTPQHFENFAVRARRQDELFQELIAAPDVNRGLDPSWIRLSPYQISAQGGQPCPIHVEVRNLGSSPLQIEASLIVPGGWRCSPLRVSLHAEPGSVARAPLTFTPSASLRTASRRSSRAASRRAIALDATVNGKHLGQITEAVVDLK